METEQNGVKIIDESGLMRRYAGIANGKALFCHESPLGAVFQSITIQGKNNLTTKKYYFISML